MVICENYRFVEPARGARPPKDLTFKFYADGRLEIIDNDTGGRLTPRDLKGASYDFYVRQRIAMIKRDLRAKMQKYA